MSAPLDISGLQALVADKAGYALTTDRANAAEARLGPIARREGVASVQDLLEGLDPSGRPSLVWEVVETMLPADSRFFRDREPFLLMCSQLLPALTQARSGKVRILSAGCATGQEAWSAAICAAEAGEALVEIVGLDLSSRAIEKARQGLYTQFEVQKGLRSRQLIRWFERQDDVWRVSDRLRLSVRFERANLLDGLEAFGRFDLIFCRHVLSDMTSEARRRTVAALERALAPNGCLFLGSGEAVPEALAAFRPVAGLSAVYVRNPSLVSRAA
jgi:chemotaxis protein methyltransferase CheR